MAFTPYPSKRGRAVIKEHNKYQYNKNKSLFVLFSFYFYITVITSTRSNIYILQLLTNNVKKT